jgi:peroxiredoxin
MTYLPDQFKRRRRFPWFFLLSSLLGLAMSAVFIALSFSELRPRSNETGVTVLSSGTLEARTAIPVTVNSSTFTTLPLNDPRAGDVQGLGRVQVGQPAPDFTLGTLDGSEATLSDFREQAVLINFWATWCEPCRIEMPEIVRAYEAHSDAGFTVLAINLTDQDALDDIQAFVEEFGMAFPVLLDSNGEVSRLYGLLGLPMSIFVDREGRIARIYIGLMSGEQIDEFVGELLE